jgi:predicted phosphohydrolase
LIGSQVTFTQKFDRVPAQLGRLAIRDKLARQRLKLVSDLPGDHIILRGNRVVDVSDKPDAIAPLCHSLSPMLSYLASTVILYLEFLARRKIIALPKIAKIRRLLR